MAIDVKFDLIIDSCCELPRELYDQPHIKMLNFLYTDGSSNCIDDLYASITPHEFYDAMRNGVTYMTAPPAAIDLERAVRESLDAGREVVYLSFTSGLSGWWERVADVRERIKGEYGEGVGAYMVDTKVASTSETVLCLEAIRQQQRGMTAREMVAWAEEARYFVHTMFMVDDLKALQRGGRIPKGVAIAGSMLDVKPLLSFDLEGALQLVGVARGRKKGLRRLAENFQEKHDAGEAPATVIIGNADCPRDAERLREMIAKQGGNPVFMLTNIGPTIGCHVGPGMVSCCFWGPDRRGGMPVSDRIASQVKVS